MTKGVATTIVAILFALPLSAAAESVTEWNLVNQQKIEGWNAMSITNVVLRPEGLQLATQTRGQLVKAANIRHAVDTVSITYASSLGANGIFFWHAKGMPSTEAYQIPISFPQTSVAQTIVMDMSKIKEWDMRTIDSIGFALDAGSEMTLKSIEFSGPGFVDSIVYPLKSFFLFDNMHAYTINFLWGPMMTFGDAQMRRLYSAYPPLGTSANSIFFAVLGIALCGALVLRKWKSGILVTLFFVLLSSIWILYDLRMGAEVMSFAKKDYATWWSKPSELRDFRDRGSFPAFAEVAAPFTKGKNHYVLLASGNWPYYGIILYATYPAYPISYEEATDADVWIVYDRPDLEQDTEGRLSIEGKPISPPGRIVRDFEPGAFVFEKTLPP